MNLLETDQQQLRVLLTVWTGAAGRWMARAELADGSTRVFDSPFELVRFVSVVPIAPTRRPDGLR